MESYNLLLSKLKQLITENNNLLTLYTKLSSSISDKLSFPLCLFVNETIDNYIPKNDYILQDGDVLKIKVGFFNAKVPIIFADSFIYEDNSLKTNTIIDKLNSLESKIKKEAYNGNTNDEIRILIEQKISKLNYQIIENCMSYEAQEGNFITINSKYIQLNPNKKYDIEGCLTTEANECFEFLENEIYNINITIYENTETNFKLKKESSQIYIKTGNFVNLKLNSSKEVYSQYKHFPCFKFNNSQSKLKLGLRDLLSKNIIKECPEYSSNVITYTKQFPIKIRQK